MRTEVRENIYRQLKIDEGIVCKIYLDHLGYLTFGIGHLITRNDPEYGMPVGTPISIERVREAFENDLDVSIRECYLLIGRENFNNLPDVAQEVLVNMIFNLGRPRLSKFKNFLEGLLEHDWNRAADEMIDSRWYRQVTNRADRLVSRIRSLAQ